MLNHPSNEKNLFCFYPYFGLTGCISDIEEISGSCTVVLNDGTTVEMTQEIRKNTRTGTITYRDEEGNLRSVFKEDYETFTCGS